MSQIETRAGISDDAKALMAFESGKKSAGIAYLLWFAVGGIGVHRFYLGHILSGVILLLVTLSGFLLLFPFIITFVWLVIDAFLIPGMTRKRNEALMNNIANGKVG